eukprot:g14818.t1
MSTLSSDERIPSVIHEISVSDYFLGVLLPRGFRRFEEAVNPVVKSEMKKAFPDQQRDLDAKAKLREDFQKRLKHYCEIVKPKEADAKEAEEINRNPNHVRYQEILSTIKNANPTWTKTKVEKKVRQTIMKPVSEFRKLLKSHQFKNKEDTKPREKLECFADDLALKKYTDPYSVVLEKNFAWIDKQKIEGLREAVTWERAQIREWYKQPSNSNPPWIEAVHRGLGPKMKDFTYDNGNDFDTFVLSVVLRNHMERVFEPLLDSDGATANGTAFVAKNVLSELLHAAYLRNQIAHDLLPPNMFDIMNAFRCMHRIVMQMCGADNAGELAAILNEGEKLLKMQGNHVARCVSSDQFAVILFDRALRIFEVCLKKEVDSKWAYKDGNIALPTVKENWRPELKKKVMSLKSNLKDISTARHWLRHNTSKKPNLHEIIPLLYKTAHALVRLQRQQANAAGGNDSEMLQMLKQHAETKWDVKAQQINIQVSLSVRAQAMAIMVPHDNKFFGRSTELKSISSALVKPGARVLVHGPPGVGKDSVAKALFDGEYSNFQMEIAKAHDPEQTKEMFYQGWVQGSSSSLLKQQLISYFEHVVLDFCDMPFANASPDREPVEIIREWLAEHDNWLFYVEDVTLESCELLQKVFPEKKGHLLLTSKSELNDTFGASMCRIRMEPLKVIESVCMWKSIVGSNVPEIDEEGVLEEFLGEKVGGLPLSLRLCAVLFKKMQRPIEEFVSEFEAMDLATLDRKGKFPEDSSANFLGLVRSTMLVVKRIKECEDNLALEVLSAMSILPPSGVPLDILNKWLPIESLERAIEVLTDYGLVQRSGSIGRSCTMHQMIARCVRNRVESQHLLESKGTVCLLMDSIFESMLSLVKSLLKRRELGYRLGSECVLILAFSAEYALNWLDNSRRRELYGVLIRSLASRRNPSGVLKWAQLADASAMTMKPRVYADVLCTFSDLNTRNRFGVSNSDIERWHRQLRTAPRFNNLTYAYNDLIKIQGILGFVDGAKDLFEEMKEKKVEINNVTYNTMIDVVGKIGKDVK